MVHYSDPQSSSKQENAERGAFWLRHAARVQRKVNVAWWLQLFLPAFCGISLVFACLVVVAPPGAKFKTAKDLKQIKAFVCDGSVGINLGLQTWHQALLPLGPEMKMVNVQGVNSGKDTHRMNFEESLHAMVEITL